MTPCSCYDDDAGARATRLLGYLMVASILFWLLLLAPLLAVCLHVR